LKDFVSHEAHQNNSIRTAFLFLQYLFFRFLALLINSLSPTLVDFLAELLGNPAFLSTRRQNFALNNLQQAFPNKSVAEIKQIARSSLKSLVLVIFEFVRIPKIYKEPKKYIEVQGGEHVWESLKLGRGVILATSHFGNWELAGIAASDYGFPMHAIGKPNKNPFVTDYVKKLRGATGLKTIDQQGAVRKCIQLLKANQVIAVLIDEHAKKGGVWVHLFGQKALTNALPATLALKYNAAIIPTFFYRRNNDRYLLTFEKPFARINTGDYDSDIISNTQQYMTRLEKELVKHPEHWTLWMHNRWRWNDLKTESHLAS
jgi:Kdo2-lipid IVA lauroyltransferase/acyltransferase